MADGDESFTSIWYKLEGDQSDPWSALKAVREARSGAFTRGDFQAVHYLQDMILELIRNSNPELYGDDQRSGDVLSFSDYQKTADDGEE